MRHYVLAEAGSSKIDWVKIGSDGVVVSAARTPGLNALTAEDDNVRAIVSEAFDAIGEHSDVDAIYYYGAGCATQTVCDRIENLIKGSLNVNEAHAYSDMLAAARGLLGYSSGVACIIGTGSNSCLYNGDEIVDNIPSLGYVLGDEGSGNAIGRRLLNAAFKRGMPEDLACEFLESYRLSVSGVLDNVYRNPGVSKFLASLAPFAKKNLTHPFIVGLLTDEFEKFIDKCVLPYKKTPGMTVSFTGGVAYNFRDLIRQVCESRGLTVGNIAETPLEGLVKFHSDKKI